MCKLNLKKAFVTLIILMVVPLLFFGCGNDDDGDWGGDGDTDMDGDGDTDGDSDSDGDWDDDDEDDTDTETDTDDCDTESQVILYLSADDSNSMAGPALARDLINRGIRVDHNIRTYEYLNYYSFNYDAPEPGHLAVTAQMRVNEDANTGEGYPEVEGPIYSLQIGVRAPDQSNEDRRRLNLTLSLDTSGSMDGEPIALVRESCLALAGSMRSGDVISIVEWSSSQTVVLESHVVDGPDDATLVGRCNAIYSGGTTDLHGGLVRAYELARENFSSDRINRVILMSDGGANTGITDEELIADEADDADGEAIYMMGVGMSDPSWYNDQLMDTVTDAGKGAYIFIDSAEEAQKMFGERFLSIAEVAARDVQVELTMPPSFEMYEFFGEEYSGDPSEVEPQHLAPNDAMIFNQMVASCDPSVVTEGDAIRVAASWSDPVTYESQIDSLDTTLEDLLEGDNSLLKKGDAIVAYAETVKAVRDIDSEEAIALIDKTLGIIGDAIDALGNDPDLLEIQSLLTSYRDQF